MKKNSDGKMGLAVERVYTCWIFLILGLFSNVSNCFFKFFCNVTRLNIDCKFKRILGPYLP